MAQSNVAIELEQLSKTYKVHERAAGVRAAFKSLFNRKWKDVSAVQDVSFQIEEGQAVGFLGPNGAGKTTTMKLLAGILYPSGGRVRVHGFEPWKREEKYLKQITLVMGRRNQIIWDVPAIDSFDFFRAVYEVPVAQYKETLDEMVQLLQLQPILNKPVRTLSLGERMRCELTGALLHRPKVLFFDEPTIGLDTLAQRQFRQFIADYVKKYGSTMLITSHYMGDVEELCKRVIFIDKGKIIYDGTLENLAQQLLPFKIVKLRLSNGTTNLERYGEVQQHVGNEVILRVPRNTAAGIVARIASEVPVSDLNLTDPPVADVLVHLYSSLRSIG